MKKNLKALPITAMLITVITLLTLLTSCNLVTPIDPLEYQKYPLSAKGNLCANNSEYVFEITMKDKDNAELKFTAPETLRGYIFRITGDKTTLSYGDMTIDFNGGNDKTNVVKLLPYVFSLDSTMQKSVENGIQQNSVSVTKAVYNKDSNEITVYIDEESKKPMRIEHNGIVINISEFSSSEAATPSTPVPTPNKTPSETPNETPSETSGNN